MKTIFKLILAATVALFASAGSFAQAPEYADGPRFSQAELDSMLAPIALYPDSMLSQLLIAATYPRDVSEAAAWSRSRQGLAGEQAVRAAENEPWDPSVKSLVAFPQVLAMMDEHMEWTERLGDAFMSNPAQVSDTIQALRGRADQAGTLRSGEEVIVRRDYDNYVIEPAAPDVVYVPYYDPRVAYGGWWWPDYPPVYWNPWPGYGYSVGYSGFAWGYGISVGPRFWYSGFDWPRRYIRFHTHRPWYYRGHSRWHDHRWYSDRDHRRNVRGWHWSGSRDGRWDRDGRRDRDGRWSRDGRQDRDGRWNRDGRQDRDGRDGRPQYRNDGIERRESWRFTQTPQPAAPAPSIPGGSIERRDSPRLAQPAPEPRSYQRGIERAPERQYVAPQAPAPSQPLSRSYGRPAPQAIEHSAPAQSLQRAPRHAAPMQVAPVQVSPAPVHVNPAPPRVRESRPAPEARESRSNDRAEPSGGGGNPLGRGGGRSRD